jgi:hypothetical protein
MTTPRGVIGIFPLLSLSISISLSPPERERPQITTICCHNLSADENDQNKYPLCGIAIKLLVDFIWDNNPN